MDEVDRLRAEGLGQRAIAARLGVTRHAVRAYLEDGGVSALAGPDPLPEAQVRRRVHPKGWEPGVAWEKDGTGLATVRVDEGDPPPNFEEVLRHFGFDPARYVIDQDRVHVRTWDMNLGSDPHTGEHRGIHVARYYRATIVPRERDDLDLEELRRELEAYEPRAPRHEGAGDHAFVLNLADWQTGKRDGDGVRGLIRRVHSMVDGVRDRVSELRAAGREMDELYIAGLGDLHEGCKGHYPQQTFNVQLNRREQTNVTRRLLRTVITELAPLFARVVVLGVPGNHGENRNDDGKSYTTAGDNDDLAILDQLYDVFQGLEAFDHVSFVIPRNELSVTLDVKGTVVNFAHGHQFAKGSNPYAKAEEWIRGQAFGRQAAGDADIYVTGHFHHFAAFEQGARTWLQCPALEDRSEHWEQTRGVTTQSGTLTFTVSGSGWGDLAIIR